MILPLPYLILGDHLVHVDSVVEVVAVDEVVEQWQGFVLVVVELFCTEPVEVVVVINIESENK